MSVALCLCRHSYTSLTLGKSPIGSHNKSTGVSVGFFFFFGIILEFCLVVFPFPSANSYTPNYFRVTPFPHIFVVVL